MVGHGWASFNGYLKADTQTNVTIGPVLSVSDGFTPVVTLTLGSADEAEIIKHAGTAVTDISGLTMAAIGSADGYYYLTLTAAVLDTEGRLTVLINDDSLILPVRQDFMVQNANVYDSLHAAATTDYLQTDLLQIGGVTQSATDLKDFADDSYDPATDSVKLVLTTTTNTDMRGTNSAALASVLGAAVGASISADLAAVKAETVLILSDSSELQNDWKNAGRLDAILDIIAADTTTDIPTTITAVKADTALILSDSSEIQGDLKDGGRLDTIFDSILTDTGTTLDDLVDDLEGRLTAARAGYLDELAAANIPADLDAVLLDTGTTLQTSLDSLTNSAGEPGQGAPPASAPLVDKIAYLYKFSRNLIYTTASRINIYNDAGAVVDHKSTISDDGVTFKREEFVTGP